MNLDKSKIFGCAIQSIELESFPLTYLDLLIRIHMSRVIHYDSIIENFHSKLSRWKASTFSFGGRLTLCKSPWIILFLPLQSARLGNKSFRETKIGILLGGKLKQEEDDLDSLGHDSCTQ
uniref:Uncharacterized protein n=1 Tax=Lactuca sativa TaxID=4236 RepID=A0A9R1WCB2_LACSA|nr:hypothetical protein LSAT_V11C200082210 [Lactuca sativa]